MESNKPGDKFESLALTFADAGSYFGYFQENLPENLTQRQIREELQQRL